MLCVFDKHQAPLYLGSKEDESWAEKTVGDLNTCFVFSMILSLDLPLRIAYPPGLLTKSCLPGQEKSSYHVFGAVCWVQWWGCTVDLCALKATM